MKKLYSRLLNGRVIISFLFCYLVLFLVNALNKLLVFSFGHGDFFYYLLNVFNSDLGLSKTALGPVVSYLMFLGSFYGSVVFPLSYLVSMSIYAAMVQVILHVFLKNPKRFSITLSIFYTVMAFFYVLTIVPYVGHLAFVILFFFLTGRELARKNSFSTSRGVLLMVAPGTVFLILSIGFLISIFKMISFF